MPNTDELLLSFNNWWYGVNKIKAALTKDERPLRIGIISAAAINYHAIIDATQTHTGTILAGIAAREKSRAQAQIDKYQIGAHCTAYGSYDELLSDAGIDAVYIPLPNGLHCEWAIKAIEAGKHVLIEKPIASNAQQVRQIEEAASRTNKVAVEAFHWRFHPAAHRVKELIESGKYGQPSSIFARLMVPPGQTSKDDIRMRYDLAGGSCMDLTYVFSACCYFASPDISKCKFSVQQTKPRLNETDQRVDEAMESSFIIEQAGKHAVSCHIRCDFSPLGIFGWIPRIWEFSPLAIIEFEHAKIELNNFVVPAYGHSITIIEKDSEGNLTGKKHTEKCYNGGPQWGAKGQPWWTTYRYQLEAFVDAVRAKEAGTEYNGPWMTLDESEKLMELIDAVYVHAKLPKRGT